MEEKIKKPRKKRKLKYSIADMQALAKANGGKCLSDEYKGINNKLQWQCKEEHTWFIPPASIIHHKSWCSICSNKVSGLKRKQTIKQMKQLAKDRDGKCLSKIYVDSHSKLQWQCKKGHVWNAAPASVKHGSWCRKCHSQKMSKKVGATLLKYQKIAEKRGGKCLSTEYINNYTNLQWQCDKGHIWMAQPLNIKAGTWCPVCAGMTKQTMEAVQVLAQKFGGKCLSEDKKAGHNLTWECAKGHVWERTLYETKNGSWCTICRKEKKEAAKKLLQDQNKEFKV
jgi:hypothetical protein